MATSATTAGKDVTRIDRKGSVASQVYDMIRSDIVRATLPPGTQVSEHGLSERYAVSRTPVREALQRLSEEGLVRIVRQVGTYVTLISLRKVYEAQFIREALECAAVRAAAASSLLDVDLLKALVGEQRTAVQNGDVESFYETDEALHAAIAAACGHPRIWVVTLSEKLQLDRVRMLDASHRPDLGELADQHAAIVDALTGRNADAAERAMRTHLHDVFSRLEPLIERFQDYFDDLDVLERGGIR